MTILADTITPTATAIRAALVASAALLAITGQRIYMGHAPDTAAYPHIIMQPAAAPEQDATHTHLSWQPQQWDIYAVADTHDAANALAGLAAAALNGTTLTIGSGSSLVVRRMGTMPAQRVRMSDTISKYMAAATMLVGVRTGGAA